jgi:hypothetical protein
LNAIPTATINTLFLVTTQFVVRVGQGALALAAAAHLRLR